MPQYASAPAPRRKRNAWIIILVLGLCAVIAVPIIGLLAAIAIPNFVKARQASQRAACVANLKAIDSAKASWALENKKTDTEMPADADIFGKYIQQKPTCPANGTYLLGTVGEKPSCTTPDHLF